MRGFSRTMSKADEVAPEQPWTPASVLLVAAICAALLGFVVWLALDLTRLGFAVGFLALLTALGAWGSYQRRRLAASRPDQSICSFARDFDRRSVDPWVIRAVWEQLQDYLVTKRGPFPVRAVDRFGKDYGMDADDINDVWDVVARRTGRSQDTTDRNPYYDRVHTVGDLVHFANHQPLPGAV